MNKTIQINQKLMEREDCLVDIYDIERQINSILGQPYPFELPTNLPSAKKPKKPRRKAAPRAPTAMRVRKLDPENEAAYRILYFDNDIEKNEIHIDPRPLALLLNTPLPHIAVQRIETVQRTSAGELIAVEQLFDADA